MLRVFLVFAVVIACTHAVLADNHDKAFKLFEDSEKAYKSGKFEKAADLLRKAYELYPDPLLLYNLARAQEGLGDTEGAIRSYERYLETAKEIPDRGAIERKVETLRAQIEKQEEEAKQRAEEEERRRQDDERRRKEDEERRRREALDVDDRTPLEKYGPWVTMGVGGAMAGTGVIFGVLASAKHDDALAAPVQRDAAELQSSAQRYATIANVLFVVGGAVAIGGGVWEYLQWSQRTSSTSSATRLRISPHGVALEWELP